MPCRDWEGERIDATNHRKRCDVLAAQLCSTRQVLYKLYRFITAYDIEISKNGESCKELPADMSEDILAEIDRLQEHRDRDKTHAILELGHKISKLRRNVKEIKVLGGKPNEDLLQEIKDLKDKQKQMKESDSLHTDLY